MVPAGTATLKGANLEDLGVQSLPEASVQVYSAQSIASGEALDFQLRGITLEGDSTPRSTQILVVAAGLVGILMLGAGIWLYFRNRKSTPEFIEKESADLSQEEILDSILALEDLFKKGEISQESYQSKRAELKEQLRKAAGGKK